jgi:hypothetical protein
MPKGAKNMPIIGFNFKSINAYVEETMATGEVSINSAPLVESIVRKDVPGFKDVLAINFKFLTKYEPKIGEIEVFGEVLYQTSDAKKILSTWEEKKLDAKLAVDVLNAIFKKCLTKVIVIADDLRLPPPITFPTVSEEPKKEKGK